MKLFVTMSSGSILLVRSKDVNEAANLTMAKLNLKDGIQIAVHEVKSDGEAEVVWKFVPR